MTVKKAIKILDWWIDHKKQAMEQLKLEWKFDYDKVSEVARMLVESDRIAISNLDW